MTRIVKRYSQEEKMVKRMLLPENCSVSKLSAETGISKLTLATWKTRALKGGVSRNQGRPKNGLSSQEKFMIVMETYTLSEIELSKYCREKGLYVEDIKKWRSSFIGANNAKQSKNINVAELKEELTEEKNKSKELKKIKIISSEKKVKWDF
ncbi:hypothetical protein ACFIJ5_10720 [Haloimpatiens sp. FM7330]|uniref:hypothetical protein n=1 Tax=Haloimpatiens sp. FM7330 TaxID=3298610 RepID=UPI003640063C